MPASRYPEPARGPASETRAPALTPADVEVWAAIRVGDTQAFDTIVREVYAPLCAAARRITRSQETAEDVVVEVLAGVWNRKAELTPTVSLRYYLYRAVHNRALNVVRADRRRPLHVPLTEAIDIADTSSSGDVSNAGVETIERAVEAAIAALPHRWRAVYVMSREQGLTHAEIASITGLSQRTVIDYLSRSLERIRLAIAPLVE